MELEFPPSAISFPEGSSTCEGSLGACSFSFSLDWPMVSYRNAQRFHGLLCLASAVAPPTNTSEAPSLSQQHLHFSALGPQSSSRTPKGLTIPKREGSRGWAWKTDRNGAYCSPTHSSVGFKLEENYLSEKGPIAAETHSHT